MASDELVARIEGYLGKLLASWATCGWDVARGGFHERLNCDWSPIAIGYRRLTACARQLFVFSKACSSGLMPGAAAVAERTYRYLVEHFRDRQHGGFVFKVDLAGAPLNRDKDLYAQAFALFALAHYVAISGDTGARSLLMETERGIARFRLPEGWYAASAAADWSDPDKRLLQNPHMHVFEAFLAAFDATGDRVFAAGARDLVLLLGGRLRDQGAGTIREFRDESGAPDASTGHIVEPGHHFEWCWLLHWASRLLREDWRADADDLFQWAFTHGIDRQRGGVFDQVSVAGHVVADTKRIWPQTEYVRARAARYADTRSPQELDALRAATEFLFARYLLADGGWHERLSGALACRDDEMPATTCYHILGALSEARAALKIASSD